MASEGTLRVRIIGDSGPLEKTLSGMGGKLAKFGAVAGAAGAAVGVGLFKVGEGLDSAFDTIRVGTGATGEALDSLKDDFRAVAKDVPADFDQVGTAVADLNTRLGLTGEPLQEMSEQFLNLSRITGEEVGPAIAAGTRVLGDFAVASEDQSEALDTLFKTSQATGIGVTELADKMTQSGAPLRQLGFDFEQSAALIGKFEKEGVNAEAILGGMKQSLGKMAKAGEAPIETFGRLSEEMANAGSAGEANAIAVEAFGTRAGPDLAAAVREGRFELDDLLDSVAGSSETINGAADDTESFGEKWQMVKNRVLLALEPVAMRVFDGMGALMDRLGPIIDTVVSTLRGFFSAFQSGGSDVSRFADGARSAVGAVASVFSTVRDVVSDVFAAIGKWVDDNRATIVEWSTKLGEVFGQIQEVVASVMGAVTEIIKVAIGIISAFWDRFGRHLVDFLGRAIGRIIDIVSGAFQILKGVFDLIKAVLTGQWGDAWDAIKDILSGAWKIIHTVIAHAWDVVKTLFGAGVAAISQVWSFLWAEVKKLAASAWKTIVKMFSKKVDEAVAFVAGLRDRVVGFFTDLKDKALALVEQLAVGYVRWVLNLRDRVLGLVRDVRDRVVGFFAGLKDRALGVAGSFVDGVTSVFDRLVGFVTGLPGRIASVASGMWTSIADGFRDMINTILGWWNDLSFDIPKVDLPGPFNFEGATVSTPNITELHSGGIFDAPRPGGEGLALLRDRERVTTPEQASRTDRIMSAILQELRRASGASPATVQAVIPLVIDGREIARSEVFIDTLSGQISRRARRNGGVGL